MTENKIMRILRESNGYSQEYIANELGINQNSYSKLESGQTRLTVDRIKKLAEIYKVAPEYFLSKDFPVVNYTLQSDQSKQLSEQYNIEARHLLADNNPVVNYNIGTYSRGITNVERYYEGSEPKPSEEK